MVFTCRAMAHDLLTQISTGATDCEQTVFCDQQNVLLRVKDPNIIIWLLLGILTEVTLVHDDDYSLNSQFQILLLSINLACDRYTGGKLED